MSTVNDNQLGKLEGLQPNATPHGIFSAAESAYSKQALQDVLNKPRTENTQAGSLLFTNIYSKESQPDDKPHDKPSEKSQSDKPNDRTPDRTPETTADAPREASEAPTPEQIKLNEQVAKGMELLKSGKIDELCKLAQEISKNGEDDKAIVHFQRKLSAESKMDITFRGAGKQVVIGTNDEDPNTRDQIVTRKSVTIKNDGTLLSAKETKSGPGIGTEKDLDPKQTYDELMKVFKKNQEQK
ncbi:MAG: hypothetical protein JST89_22430 [Cyanobacteria bacterium SZAS-4]|nr:hypothetical protein [Cyanobacteria bacterium SZAS-4]